MKLRVKIWLERDGKVFGDGAADLLERVRRLGSLRRAALELGMSYAQAWQLVRDLESRLGFPLLERRVGGRGGGGSGLTPAAVSLLERYRAFRRESQDFVEDSFRRHLASTFGDYQVIPPGQRNPR
ncbi:MAG: LysR family transcriptional regulator [Bacillota bacterium]